MAKTEETQKHQPVIALAIIQAHVGYAGYLALQMPEGEARTKLLHELEIIEGYSRPEPEERT